MVTRCKDTFAYYLNGMDSRFQDNKGRSLCTDKKHRFWSLFQRTDGPDKLLKMADPLLDTIGEIAAAAGASDSTLEGIGKGRALAKTGRDAIGFFNIFNGVIPNLVQSMKNIFHLMRGLITGDNVSLEAGSEKYNDVAKSTTEKILAAGANFGRGVGSGTYIVGYGLCRPLANIEKYGEVSLGQTAHNIGQAFPTFMMVNHLGEMIGSTCEMGFQYTAFNRAIDNTSGKPSEIYQEFEKQMLDNTLSLLEKSLELLYDIVKLIGQAIPAWFRLPLTLGIATLSLYKVWLKTA